MVEMTIVSGFFLFTVYSSIESIPTLPHREKTWKTRKTPNFGFTSNCCYLEVIAGNHFYGQSTITLQTDGASSVLSVNWFSEGAFS